MIDLRPVGSIIGLLLVALGAMMLLPMGLDWSDGHGNWRAFGASALISAGLGGMVALSCFVPRERGLDLRQSFLLTAATWTVLPLLGALPFMLGAPQVGFSAAVFEAVSGMTTTGTTIFPDLDDLPRGTHLWRGILQWLGGLGIVIVAMIFLPVMKVGGMQFFRSEGFDTLEKVLPRALDISAALIRIYIALTLACLIAFSAFGMQPFEAVVHSLTTVSTGGFSTTNASFAIYAGPLEYVAILFMLLASLPFIRFIQLTQGSFRPLWRDMQVRAYLRWNLYAIVAVLLWMLSQGGVTDLLARLREVAFNLVSTFSGTGFTSVDLSLWGAFPFVVLIGVGLIGGCTSSTGCSVKVFRYLVLFEAVRVQIQRISSPSAVVQPRYDGRRLEGDVISSVILLFALFMLTFWALAVTLSLTGLELRTALTAAWSTLANIGPVFGPEVSANGAVERFPLLAQWIMIAGMIIGRLELLAIYVLFLARFWRG